MKFTISCIARITLFALTVTISTSSVFASSSAQTANLLIAQDTKPATTPPPPPPTRKAPAKKQPATKPATKQQEPTQEKDNAQLVYVLMQTTMGDIVIELNREKAPVTVKNFLSYTDKKYFDGTIFHRVMARFMIQGGGFTEDMNKKPTYKPIKNEYRNGLSNVYKSIAMARLPRQPDSATAQFFINVKDNLNLDIGNDGAGYAVFGKVVAGMEVVHKIESTPTTTINRRPNVPVETIFIKKVTRMTDEEAKKRIEQEKKPSTKK